jgi:hypothetical protein
MLRYSALGVHSRCEVRLGAKASPQVAARPLRYDNSYCMVYAPRNVAALTGGIVNTLNATLWRWVVWWCVFGMGGRQLSPQELSQYLLRQ